MSLAHLRCVKRSFWSIAAAAALVACSHASAQSYPARPVRMIAPFPAGGGYDFMAPSIGQRLHESPVKSLKELIAFAKARPAEVTFGSPSTGSGQHFGLEQLKLMTGTNFTHVPYKGAAPLHGALLHGALLAGEVSVAFNIIQLPLPYVRNGRLRALATASTKRTALATDIPTMAELGYPIDFDTWYAVYAPAGTPKEIVSKLNGEINKALAHPDFKEKAGVLGLELLGTSPDKLTAHMKAEIARWVSVAKAANIKLD